MRTIKEPGHIPIDIYSRTSPLCTSSQRPLNPASACPSIPSQETPTSATTTWIHADAPTIGTRVSCTPTVRQSRNVTTPPHFEIVTKYPHLRGGLKDGGITCKACAQNLFWEGADVSKHCNGIQGLPSTACWWRTSTEANYLNSMSRVPIETNACWRVCGGKV